MHLNNPHSRGRLGLLRGCLGYVCICVSDNFMDFLPVTFVDFLCNCRLSFMLESQVLFSTWSGLSFYSPGTFQLLFDNKKKIMSWSYNSQYTTCCKKFAKLKSEKIKSAALCPTRSAFMCSHRFRLFANFQRILQQEPMTLAL